MAFKKKTCVLYCVPGDAVAPHVLQTVGYAQALWLVRVRTRVSLRQLTRAQQRAVQIHGGLQASRWAAVVCARVFLLRRICKTASNHKALSERLSRSSSSSIKVRVMLVCPSVYLIVLLFVRTHHAQYLRRISLCCLLSADPQQPTRRLCVSKHTSRIAARRVATKRERP